MAATDVGVRNVPPVDDLDDSLFNYDVGDVFRDVDTNMDVPAVQKPAARVDGKDNGAGLGIDQEIKVTKKRALVPKLDENRLLSPAGIPKLRRVAKKRLKFNGKGHEYSDVARLLNVYQLWLDDLYPRAKFADGLAIIEKLGHTKRMQTMRRELINEGKPRESLDSFGEGAERSAGEQTSSKYGQDQLWEVKSSERPRTPVAVVGDEDDLYTATPKFSRDDGVTKRNGDMENLFVNADDDLEEGSTKTAPTLDQKTGSLKEENFDDDEEALLDVW